MLDGTNRAWVAGPANYSDADTQRLEYGECPAWFPADFEQQVRDRANGTFWDYVSKIPVIGGQAPPVEPADYIKAGLVTRLSEGQFGATLHEVVATSASKSVVVFIHGFDNTFNQACQRTAQMAWDLDKSIAPVMFSWPATGTLALTAYNHDLQSAMNAVDQLHSFLNTVVHASGASSVHIIAHSLGNRILLAALKSLEKSGIAGAQPFDQTVLAAPDIDRVAFLQAYPALRHLSRKASIYVSSHDSALKASEKFWAQTPRIGDARYLQVFEGMDTIDVSSIDFQYFGMGHAYFANNRLVIDDIGDLIAHQTAPPRLHLQKRWLGDQVYWQFPK